MLQILLYLLAGYSHPINRGEQQGSQIAMNTSVGNSTAECRGLVVLSKQLKNLKGVQKMKIQRKRFARLLAPDANFEKNLLKSAYHMWLKDYQFKHIDVQGLANVTDIKGSFQNPQIKNCRRALYFSAGEMAKRLSMSRSSYQDIEKREAHGSVSLHILNKVARAMNCDLYYCIRPKNN